MTLFTLIPRGSIRCIPKKGLAVRRKAITPPCGLKIYAPCRLAQSQRKTVRFSSGSPFPISGRAYPSLTHGDLPTRRLPLSGVKLNKKAPTLFWGMGYWTRANVELCLLATRGRPRRQCAGVHQVIMAPVEQHSKKPGIVRDKIITLMGDLPRVELFARQQAPGWDVWGNEVESDLCLSPE